MDTKKIAKELEEHEEIDPFYAELTKAERRAMKKLAKDGYAHPSKSQIGVIRVALREAWERFYYGFQDKPFPGGQDEN